MLHGHPEIHVKNLVQLVLLEWELKGQISDGYWENTRPYNHWQRPCSAKVVIAKDSSRVGKNFSSNKENYDFTASMLLECVGDRMIRYATFAKALGDNFEAFFAPIKGKHEQRSIDYFFDENFNVKIPLSDNEYWKSMVECFSTMDLESLSQKCKAVSYDMTQLRRDLNELKAIFKICDPSLSD